jgi:hypothetical protein
MAGAGRPFQGQADVAVNGVVTPSLIVSAPDSHISGGRGG